MKPNAFAHWRICKTESDWVKIEVMDKLTENHQNWLNPNTPNSGCCRLYAGLEELSQFANQLANRTGISNALIALQGDLGAGKTTFTRLLLQHLGHIGHVKSPTYALMENYALGPWPERNQQSFSAFHFDFYRMHDQQEWEDAGFRDVFSQPGLKLVEWPHNAYDMLPTPDLVIHLLIEPDSRRNILVNAFTTIGLGLIQ